MNTSRSLVLLLAIACLGALFSGCTGLDHDAPDPSPDGDAPQEEERSEIGDAAGDGEWNESGESFDRDAAEGDTPENADLNPFPYSKGDACMAAPHLVETLPDETFDIGPYVMNLTGQSAVIMWRDSSLRAGRVRFGEDAAHLDRLDEETLADHQFSARAYRLPPQLPTRDENGDERLQSFIRDLGVVHRVEINGLEPNTRYYYRVESAERTTATLLFFTAPTSNQGFRFVLVGDSQGNPDLFGRLAQHFSASAPALILHTGDAVLNSTVADAYKTELFDPLRALLHHVPLYLTMGNHDAESPNWYALTRYPNDNKDPSRASTYSFVYGNTYFLVINTNRDYVPQNGHPSALSRHIESELASPAAQKATWRIAVTHHPAYTDGWWAPDDCHYMGARGIQLWLMGLLEKNHFHLLLSGHAHEYERGQVGSVLTIVSGGGGGVLDRFCRRVPEVSVASYVHHYVELTMGCRELSLRALDLEGKILDRVTLAADPYGKIISADPPNTPPLP